MNLKEFHAPKLSLREMLKEFRAFAFKGNMVDMAVGLVIGAAFGTVIKSVVDNVIMPIVGLVPGLKGGYEKWHLGPVLIGKVLADLLNFTIVAFAVFLIIVKLLGAVMKATHRKPASPDEPATKECPLCLSTIPYKAAKCAHCTADLAAGPPPTVPAVAPA